MSLTLGAIRDALEGGAPAQIATGSAEGEPNVSYLSDVCFVDERHLALSFQFFNRTRRNVMANPIARLIVRHAGNGQCWRVLVQYLHTETEGPLFERMRARLAGIASHEGVADVFRLRGADLYRVLSIDPVPGTPLALPPRPGVLAPLRAAMAAVQRAHDLETLFDEMLDAIVREFSIPHAMLLIRDADTGRAFVVASRGYDGSGVGAEVGDGCGVIGVAAGFGTPVRINHALAEQAYMRAVRAEIARDESDDAFEAPIPLPGLAAPGSQMALPIKDGERVLGVLYVEHPQGDRFGYDLEDALATIADAAGLAMRSLDGQAPTRPGGDETAAARATRAVPSGAPIQVRCDPRTHSVFVDDEYVIRGVAGAVLWKMLQACVDEGRSEFSHRSLRADPALKLPDVTDNLAARLILLARQLDERDCGIRLHRSGRGRVALALGRPLRLVRDAG